MKVSELTLVTPRPKVVAGAILIALMLLGLGLIPPAFAEPTETAFHNVTVDSAYDMLTSGDFPDLIVLDVRYQHEYDAGHLYDAFLVPYDELEKRTGELEQHKDHEVLVYCRSGYRSQIACEVLVEHNFEKVYNMLGGILAWIDASYPLRTTYHHVTVNVLDTEVLLQIEPLFQDGCPCTQNQGCPSGSELQNIQTTVLEEEEGYTVVLLTYEVNGTTFEFTVVTSLLWSYNELMDGIDRTTRFISTEITAEDASTQFYSLDHLLQNVEYNLTLHTSLTPLNSETYNSSFTIMNYAPAGESETTSFELVEFNSSVTLSQQYTILGKVAKEVGKVYQKSGDETLAELAQGYYTMLQEAEYLSKLVEKQLPEYDRKILESSAILIDPCDWGCLLACVLQNPEILAQCVVSCTGCVTGFAFLCPLCIMCVLGYGTIGALCGILCCPEEPEVQGLEVAYESGSLSGTGGTHTFSVSDLSGTFTVVMAGNEEADFDLYAKWGSAPTTSSYDARGFSIYSLEHFTMEGSGTLYVMVRSWYGSGHWVCNILTGSPSANGGRKVGTLSQLTNNPGFETGTASSWTIGGYGDHRVTSEDRRIGSYSMLIGYKYSPNVASTRDWVYQTVTIPSYATNVQFSFYYHLFTEDYAPYDWFEVYVRSSSGSNLAQVFYKAGTTAGLEEFGWERVTYDLSAYAGQTIQLYFAVANWYDTAFKTWCYIDDVSVTYDMTYSLAGGSRAWVYLAGPESGDFDLYIKWGSPPTKSSYDDRGFSGWSQEICTAEGSGTLYYMVNSWYGYGAYTILALIF